MFPVIQQLWLVIWRPCWLAGTTSKRRIWWICSRRPSTLKVCCISCAEHARAIPELVIHSFPQKNGHACDFIVVDGYGCNAPAAAVRCASVRRGDRIWGLRLAATPLVHCCDRGIRGCRGLLDASASAIGAGYGARGALLAGVLQHPGAPARLLPRYCEFQRWQ